MDSRIAAVRRTERYGLRVADFGVDTAVSGGDGRYSATLAEGWEIWGPQGGYVSTVALRAAAAQTTFPRPASFACHFLRPARSGAVDVRVDSLARSRRAESMRVTLVQNDAAILEALVWCVAELAGIDHHAPTRPEVPDPEDIQPWETYLPDGEPPFPFWRKVDVRWSSPGPTEWEQAREPRALVWERLRVRPPLEDPYVDAGRMLLLADSLMYPAATLAHDELFPYVAPSMDLAMSFHAAGADSDWLLIDADAPLSAGALVSGRAAVWSKDGRLLASAMQQMLQRT